MGRRDRWEGVNKGKDRVKGQDMGSLEVQTCDRMR